MLGTKQSLENAQPLLYPSWNLKNFMVLAIGRTNAPLNGASSKNTSSNATSLQCLSACPWLRIVEGCQWRTCWNDIAWSLDRKKRLQLDNLSNFNLVPSMFCVVKNVDWTKRCPHIPICRISSFTPLTFSMSFLLPPMSRHSPWNTTMAILVWGTLQAGGAACVTDQQIVALADIQSCLMGLGGFRVIQSQYDFGYNSEQLKMLANLANRYLLFRFNQTSPSVVGNVAGSHGSLRNRNWQMCWNTCIHTYDTAYVNDIHYIWLKNKYTHVEISGCEKPNCLKNTCSKHRQNKSRQ